MKKVSDVWVCVPVIVVTLEEVTSEAAGQLLETPPQHKLFNRSRLMTEQ